VRKADSMLRQLNIPVMGVVENMSYYPCPAGGGDHEIFGPSHVEELAAAVDAQRWVRLPLDPQLALLGDAGRIEEYRVENLLEILG